MTDDQPMTDEECLLAQIRHLRQMWRDATNWKSAYTEAEWIRTEQFYATMIRIRFERLLALKPDDETAQMGYETAVNILLGLDRERQWLGRAGAGPDGPRVDGA